MFKQADSRFIFALNWGIPFSLHGTINGLQLPNSHKALFSHWNSGFMRPTNGVNRPVRAVLEDKFEMVRHKWIRCHPPPLRLLFARCEPEEGVIFIMLQRPHLTIKALEGHL